VNFISPNTTWLMQPPNKRAIANLKAYDLGQTSLHAVNAMDRDANLRVQGTVIYIMLF
jgi:hypothetical protein